MDVRRKSNRKKIITILVIFVWCVILFVPAKVRCLDGGTTIYTSLTYKVIIWKRFAIRRGDSAERAEGTEVHLFPNNFHDLEYYWEKSEYNPDNK